VRFTCSRLRIAVRLTEPDSGSPYLWRVSGLAYSALLASGCECHSSGATQLASGFSTLGEAVSLAAFLENLYSTNW